MKLDLNRLIASFEEIVGWPYVSPGSNDQNGIDCSGAFVRAYKAQGASIYHGSNRIIRAYCSDAFSLTSVEQLEPGMAVFKWRGDGAEPSDYKSGGRYYDPDLVGNFYHIGLVASVDPLRIIHATPPVAKVDTTIKGTSGTPWCWAAHLDAVDYVMAGKPMLKATPSPGEVWGTVTTVSGGLIMRAMQKANAAYVLTIPKGSRIRILQTSATDGVLWGMTNWENANGLHRGWVSMSYVTLDADAVTSEPETAEDDGAIAQAKALIRQALAILEGGVL